jgi:uncharacterized membrane protein
MPDRDGPPPWAYGHHWGHGAWAGDFFSLLATLGWIVLLVGLAWLALRWLVPYLRPRIVAMLAQAPDAPSALEVLRQRYARGEIDTWTFEHMWERLEATYWQEPLDALPASRVSRRATKTQRIRRSPPLSQAERQTSSARHRRQPGGARKRRPVRAYRPTVPD